MNSPKINIDYSKCQDCGICVEECLNHKTLSGHKHTDHNYDYCDRCLHCYAVCPANAISLNGQKQNPDKINIEPEALLSHFMYRRSYRRFLDKALSHFEIEQLSKAATYIPSGGNDHRLNITLIKTIEKRKELMLAILNYYKGIEKLLKNPLLRIIARQIGDAKVKATLKDPFYFNKILRLIEDIENIDDPVFYHAPAVFIFHTDRVMATAKEDCILAAYNTVLMAESLGLGSCFVSLSQQAISNDKKCKKILSLPHLHRVEAVVIVGHPKRIYKRPAWRKMKKVSIV